MNSMSLARRYGFVRDATDLEYRPSGRQLGIYPGEKSDKWDIPSDIKVVFNQLNSTIETKYTREYLKICMFYNKLFPSLKMTQWTRTSYNVPPFTALDQERSDTGTGISANYLKQIIDQVVARCGSVSFEAKLLADVPTLEFVIFKDEVERMLRRIVRDEDISAMCTEAFHDAAILGFSHIIIDPFKKCFLKVNDYEAGFFEAQFNHGSVKQFLYRDYGFPVTELPIYINHCDQDLKDEIIEEWGDRQLVDFKMYFDCPAHKVWIIINGKTLPPVEYPFDEVQMETFKWDIGFSKVTVTSLFDLLYPCQRELNKIMAKLQQMLRMYKGPVPIFPMDVGLEMKAISNGGGEALYVDSAVPLDKLITVINPTPLDAAMESTIQSRKTEMQELAGVQSMKFDMDQIRSAASMIALEQTGDTVFQSQMQGKARFVKGLFKRWVNFMVGIGAENPTIDWKDVKALLDNAYADLTPVYVTDPIGNAANAKEPQVPPDYEQMLYGRLIIAIFRDKFKYEDCTYLVDKGKLLPLLAVTMIRLSALGVPIPASAEMFLIQCFVEGIQAGVIDLVAQQPPMDQEPLPEDQGPPPEDQPPAE